MAPSPHASRTGMPSPPRRTAPGPRPPSARPPSARPDRTIVHGVDFTSAPTRAKPIAWLECELDGGTLRAGALRELRSFADFEAELARPGPWIAGLDLPFAQSRTFLENAGWPTTWRGHVEHAAALGRAGFREALDAYRAPRAPGDREHRRATDVAAGSISPQKLYGVPVGLMFVEGAPRLLASGATIAGLHAGDPERIAVEAYPGALARALVGRRSYKSDTRSRQTPALAETRRAILDRLREGALSKTHGVTVEAPDALAGDPRGDALDALLSAVQAAWAWTRRDEGFGMPPGTDPLEGWIAEPTLAR